MYVPVTRAVGGHVTLASVTFREVLLNFTVHTTFHTRACLQKYEFLRWEDNLNYKLPREIFMLRIRCLVTLTVF